MYKNESSLDCICFYTNTPIKYNWKAIFRKEQLGWGRFCWEGSLPSLWGQHSTGAPSPPRGLLGQILEGFASSFQVSVACLLPSMRGWGLVGHGAALPSQEQSPNRP